MTFLYLQIIFTIISALFIAAVLPVGAFFGWTYALICIACAVLFYVLMLLCKQARRVDNSTQNNSEEDTSQEKDE